MQLLRDWPWPVNVFAKKWNNRSFTHSRSRNVRYSVHSSNKEKTMPMQEPIGVKGRFLLTSRAIKNSEPFVAFVYSNEFCSRYFSLYLERYMYKRLDIMRSILINVFRYRAHSIFDGKTLDFSIDRFLENRYKW